MSISYTSSDLISPAFVSIIVTGGGHQPCYDGLFVSAQRLSALGDQDQTGQLDNNARYPSSLDRPIRSH